MSEKKRCQRSEENNEWKIFGLVVKLHCTCQEENFWAIRSTQPEGANHCRRMSTYWGIDFTVVIYIATEFMGQQRNTSCMVSNDSSKTLHALIRHIEVNFQNSPKVIAKFARVSYVTFKSLKTTVSLQVSRCKRISFAWSRLFSKFTLIFNWSCSMKWDDKVFYQIKNSSYR